jgi:predicted O-methyltransferase YrrM
MTDTVSFVEYAFGVKARPGVVEIPCAGRSGLQRLLMSMGARRGAEIGVWKGEHAAQLCAGVPGLHLLAVDPWRVQPGYREKKNNAALLDAAYTEATARLAEHDCRVFRGTSQEGARIVPDRSLDFVYIDANHLATHVRRDLDAWSPKVRPGGIVAGHDYVDQAKSTAFIEVKAAVDQFVREQRIETVFVLTGDKLPSFFWVA